VNVVVEGEPVAVRARGRSTESLATQLTLLSVGAQVSGRGWSGHGRNKGDDGEAEAMPTPPSTLFGTKIMRTCATPHSQVKWIKQTATGRYRFG
jgi:hypothetical protein